MEFQKKRDNTIDILKGIGIILMVIGHASCPKLLRDFIYPFHMPLFFIASGYFFKDKNISEKWSFVVRKIKSIYIPFLLCSLAFLLLHNLFFKLGIINNQYGAITGTVSALYSLQEIIDRFMKIVFKMDFYEFYLLGAYWFMRAMFFSSLIMCFGTWFLNIFLKSVTKSIITLSILCLLIAGILRYTGYPLPYIAQGGFREMMAVFFIGVGYMIRKKQEILLKSVAIPILALILYCAICCIYSPSLSYLGNCYDYMAIPFTGVTGTYIVYYLSSIWSKSNSSKLISYIGRKSLWILTLHLLMFKLSELLEITLYDLPIQMIGCHTVIPAKDNWFFLIHTFVAISIPTILAYLFTSKNKLIHTKKLDI